MRQNLFTVKETAERLQVQKETVRWYIKNGTLEAIKLPNGRYRIFEKTLEDYINSRGAENGK